MRPIAVVLAVLVAVAALPGVADAKTRKFVAYLSGTQVSTWEQPRYESAPDCYQHFWFEGGGSEKITFRSARPQRLLAIGAGRNVTFLYGTWRMRGNYEKGLRVKGTVAREGEQSNGTVPGPCGSGLPVSRVGGPYDCGSRSAEWNAGVRLGEGISYLALADPFLRDAYKRFASCPVFVPPGVDAGDFTALTAGASTKKLFTSDKTIVVGKHATFDKEFPGQGGGVLTAVSTIRWSLRLKPVD